jgi:UDP-2,3-diacylglucosamine hydrolase
MSCLFFDFLERHAKSADRLYILGDLFEYWAGDDDLADPFNQAIAAALLGLAQTGVAIFVMHGNRDFLLGAGFCRAAGVTLLTDPARINLSGQPTLLLHGDTLCTDDLDYQQFRAQVRDPAWQQTFLAQPLAQRKAIAEQYRKTSEAEKQSKPTAIMDASQAAIAALLREHGYPRVIHGHTHRPARHLHHLDGRTCERWVLTDWYERGGYLRSDENGCEAMTLTP